MQAEDKKDERYKRIEKKGRRKIRKWIMNSEKRAY
jgi:hypothetical protein